MTIARDDARDSARRALAPGERSAVEGIRGLRWWVVVLGAAALAVLGVVVDMWLTGQLGVAFTICFPAGSILAAVWVRRSELFATMVQPPLLLAASVPVGVVASGSLPATGGLTSTALALGAPMINGFPAMAITTVACLVIAFVRSRTQRLPASDSPDVKPLPPQRAAGRPSGERGREPRDDSARPAQRRPDERRPDERRPDERRPAAAGGSGTASSPKSPKPPSGRSTPGKGSAGAEGVRKKGSPGGAAAPGVRRVPGTPPGRPRTESSSPERPRPPGRQAPRREPPPA